MLWYYIIIFGHSCSVHYCTNTMKTAKKLTELTRKELQLKKEQTREPITDPDILLKNQYIVLASPFIIIFTNFLVALAFGPFLDKWTFIPIILVEWCLFAFFIFKYAGAVAIQQWVQKPKGNWGWTIATLFIAITPLPIFLKHYSLLNDWSIWLPWLLLAVINPWMEEFYWRGLLLDFTKKWSPLLAILFTSFTFAINHAVFGIHSELFRGYEVVISTFIMGVVWGFTYKKTNSLRWVVFAHFLVDFLNLSVPSFLDLFKPGW